MGDAAMLGQVLNILIGNAVKFTIEGEVLATVSLLAAGSAGPRLRSEVCDSGTGLGLSIAQRLVRLLGGEIAVECDVGRGSVFSFDLPCELAS